jgi:hypothetical protein
MLRERTTNILTQVCGPKRCRLNKPKPPGALHHWNPTFWALVCGLSRIIRTVVPARILLRSDPQTVCTPRAKRTQSESSEVPFLLSIVKRGAVVPSALM